MYADSLHWLTVHFDRLCGTSKTRSAIIGGENIDDLRKSWHVGLEGFSEQRKRYLLYQQGSSKN